jgi:hypothetical protein
MQGWFWLCILQMKNIMMNLKYFLYIAAFSAVFVSSPAQADWDASFVSPSGPKAPMRIDFPADMDLMTMITLGVELDGTDITAMLSLDGEDFVYTPVQPLEAGEHTVRLVVLGDVAEDKGSWNFTVGGTASGEPVQGGMPSAAQIARAESWLRSGSLEVDTLTEVSDRTFDDDLGGDRPKSTIISGAGDISAQISSKNWAVKARANYLLQSDHSLALTGNTVDLGEYDITADYSGDTLKGGVTLGHHGIDVNTNLFSNFYRRGASVRLGSADERLTAQGFAFRPESLSGARDFTGLNDNEDRLEGGTASFKPFSTDAGALKVTGVYYDGRGGDGGTGTAVSARSSTGSGWGALIEKSFKQERIKLRGEYSHALFDIDGGGGTADEDEGDAISLSVEARPFDSVVLLGRAADIVLGARYDRIDTFFESLANQGQAADRNAWLAYGNLYWGALSGNLQFQHETNNVDDLIGAPTDRMRNASLNLSYSFDQQTWLGTPYLNFSGFVADLDRMETAVGYTGNNTNSVSDSTTLGGGSNYGAWYWSASHTLSQFEDYTNTSNDTVNNYTSLGAGWVINERFDINGGVSFGVIRDEDAADTTYDTNFNLGVNAVLIPRTLDLNLDYNLNLASGSGDSPDRQVVNSEVEYTIFEPSRNRPGLALAVRGSMEDENGNSNGTNDETEYLVFTVLRVKAPFNFGF